MGNATPVGKSVWYWTLSNCGGGDMHKLAGAAHDAGVQHAVFKVSDGVVTFNDGLLAKAVDEFDAQGITCWGYQYSYGAWPSGSPLPVVCVADREGALLASQVEKYGLAGGVADCEGKWERRGSAGWVDKYVGGYRAGTSKPLGLSTYRWASVHPAFPWKGWSVADFFMPQVYWEWAHNPAVQLGRCVSEYKQVSTAPVIPIGAAYFESGWGPTAGEIADMAKAAHALGLQGVSWWAWDDHGLQEHPDWLATVTADVWTVEAPPPPPVPPVTASDHDALVSLISWARTQANPYQGPGV